MPKKICNYFGCHKLINYADRYCDEHKQEDTQRHKTYDEHRRNKKAAEFYHTEEWGEVRAYVLRIYKGLDLYEYYINKKIVYADTVHHIIELKDDWDKRLSTSNLFPLSSSNHGKIHKLYKKDKERIQKMLFELLKKWEEEIQSL